MVGGYAYKDKTDKEAVEEAYSYCLEHGSSSCCTTNTYIKNECGAIVIGKNGSYVFGLGVGDSKEEAIQRAFAECDDKNGNNCRLKKEFCSYDK